MTDNTYFYSNRYADYYCADAPKLGICPICESFGPDGRTCWECEEEGQCPPSFMTRIADGDGSVSNTDMDGLLFFRA